MTSNLTVHLDGGCGNQLFQFFAGFYVGQKTERHLNVNTRRVTSNRHGGHCISDFDYFSSLSRVSFISEAEKGMFVRKIKENLGKIFQADGIGYPKNFESMNRAEKITGYFQTYFFFEELLKNGLIDIVDFRTNLLRGVNYKILREIDFATSTVIHVRGGDYLAQKQTLGTLSAAYYSAVNHRLSTTSSTTYIISDDPKEVVSKRIGGHFHYNYIDTSKLHPLEVIGLVSEFQYIGISNSTLSWWGAYLRKSGTVIAPQAWFRALESPELLLPPDWALERSVWEE